MPATLDRIDNVAELIHRLGGIPPERILWTPRPGTATEADALRINDGEPKRLVELVDGTLVEKPMGRKESFLAGWLVTRLNMFVVPRRLGMVGGPDALVRVLPTQVRLPDVSYYPWHSLPGDEVHARIGSFVPPLACEILSDSNTPKEIKRKMKEFFAAGTELFWIVDPKTETVRVHTAVAKFTTLTTADTLEGGEVLNGFLLPVSELFGYTDSPSAE